MRTEKQDIIELLAKNEEKVSELYLLYAEKFKDMYNFWFLLSNEETNHANWLRELKGELLSGALLLDEKKFNPQAITLFGDYLEQRSKGAKEKDLTIKAALSIALDIENALIEKKWFEVMQSDSTAVKNTLIRLKDALSEHKNKISETLNNLK